MEAAFGASDAAGAWTWKEAYDACEAAQVLFLRRFGPAMRARADGAPAAMLPMLARLAALLPSHTKRSETSRDLQQFSTPIELGFVASVAAGLTPADLVLEPSAGTGLLAIFAEIAGSRLALNEIAAGRAELLACLFPRAPLTRHDAETLHDRLDGEVRPTVVLMNPPFSASPHVEGRVADAALKHLTTALARLSPGGRLVAITGANVAPDRARVARCVRPPPGEWARRVHRRRCGTRLCSPRHQDRDASDRDRSRTGNGSGRFPVLARHGRHCSDAARLGPELRTAAPAPRLPSPARPARKQSGPGAVLRRYSRGQPQLLRRLSLRSGRRPIPSTARRSFELAYEVRDWVAREGTQLTDSLYEAYEVQAVGIPDAKPHPTSLVQSAAMASVAPPKPSYRPHLLGHLVTEGVLSGAQLESIVYAGEAHATHLAGAFTRRRDLRRRLRRARRCRRTPCASAAAGSSATAPAPARAARSRASSSTTGSRAGAAPCGSRSPTS